MSEGMCSQELSRDQSAVEKPDPSNRRVAPANYRVVAPESAHKFNLQNGEDTNYNPPTGI
jgi:hypothetical protein